VTLEKPIASLEDMFLS
jgi:hypothetical protein